MIAESARLRLRRLHEDDAAFVLRLVNEPAFREHIGEKNLHSLDEARRFLREGTWTCQEREGYGQFLVECRETGEPVGVCGLLYRTELDVSDVGFALLPEARGRGYALEAALAVMEYGRNRLGLAEICALVSPGNVASIRVLERLGMAHVRTLDTDGRVTLLYTHPA